MTKTYKFIVWVSLVLLLVLGFKVLTMPSGKFGGDLVSTLATHFVNGLNIGTSDQLTVSSSGALTTSGAFTTTGNVSAADITGTGTLTAQTYKTEAVGSSSSSPAALGSAVTGHFVLAAAATTANASTTAVTANSSIILQVEQSTPIAGTTCNTTIPTSTPVVDSKIASNGFIVEVDTAPVTNPLCLAFWVIN